MARLRELCGWRGAAEVVLVWNGGATRFEDFVAAGAHRKGAESRWQEWRELLHAPPQTSG